MNQVDTASRLARQMAFLIECDRLKDIVRQSLCIRSRRNENSAEHSWHLALFAIVLAEHENTASSETAQPPLDVLRVVKMLILHDIVEIDAGDTFAYDDAAGATQHEREANAATRLFGLLPEDQAKDFRSLWDEFEARTTREARFAQALDRVQPVLLNCLTEGRAWRDNGVTANQVLARNARIGEGSARLWQHLQDLIRRAIADGHLPAD
ncbi:HD family hydrolase [Nibricoccus sp. IMCC34717]|uniref:HD domain-containing protein n=1 Tax=Nibricoccus sp. IMCC34717 TaxID=3034021 RepID=UPI0038510C36